MGDGGLGDAEGAGGGGLGAMPGYRTQDEESFDVDHQTIIPLRFR